MKETVENPSETPFDVTLERNERALICTLINANDALLETLTELRPEMFSVPLYAFAFEAMCAIAGRGGVVDFVLLHTEMRIINELRWHAAGGIDSLTNVMQQQTSLDALSGYVQEVKRCYLLRTLHGLFSSLLGKAGVFETDAEELLAEAERELLALRKHMLLKESLRPIGAVAKEVLEIHRKQYETGINERCISSGIAELDYVIGGLYKGELTVLGGRPSDGKTAVAMHIAMQVAQRGEAVCFYSMEMTSLQTMNRYFSGLAPVDASVLRISGTQAGDLKRMQRVVNELQPIPLFFDHTPNNSVEHIRTQALLQKRLGKCDLLIVDYLHLLRKPSGKHETMDQIIGRLIEGLKRLAEELDIPVLVLSQMNRNAETRGDRFHLPEIHDLRDSGTIEQVADCVMFVYNPLRHGMMEDPDTHKSTQGVGMLFVKKCRNGSTGDARFRRNESFTQIMNY